MRFGIIGAGAIGCLFGARLTLAGHDVTLIHRDHSIVQAIQKYGVGLRETDGTTARVRVPARKGPTRLPRAEVLIISVKAYDTGMVATSYRSMVSRETTVLSLQNGLGNLETLQSVFRSQVVAGSTTEGASSTGPGKVAHTGRGLTVIGEPRRTGSDSASRIKAAFNDAGFRTKTSSNTRGVLWTKAIINAAINPLSTLTRLPNGLLAESQSIREIAFRAMDEGALVSRAERVILVGDPKRLWRKILLATRSNKSSMLQDIENGKMTEIRQLNGVIVSLGRKRRVKTPINQILTKLVMGLEESSEP